MSRILLLEDDLSLIDGLSYSLKKQGFEIDIARTVKEAHSFWSNGKYDLLILDVSLPDGSGFDVCKKVRQIRLRWGKGGKVLWAAKHSYSLNRVLG